MTDSEEDFLKRWSRRKVEAREGLRKKTAEPPPSGEGESVPSQAEGQAGPQDKAPAQAVDESAFDDVDFDKLDFTSDYTRFMQKGVPAAIQRRALRQLWKSDPVLACVDGLNDYDLDYTDAATVVKNLKTAWQVGRGYLSEEEKEAETASAEGEETAPASQEAGEAAGEAAPESDAGGEAQSVAAADEAAAEPQDKA